ncbi:hypothetical protein IJ384_00630 [bacterium]|nr:hypothetical protein [bacterium]
MILAINNALKTQYNKQQTKIQNKNNSPNFKSIHILEISNKYKHLESTLLSEIKQFVKNQTNASSIGKGLFSEVFQFDKLKGFVIKKPFGKDNLNREANTLKALPSSLPNSQQFVARAYDDETYKYYLISTLVNGKSPHPVLRPWTKDSLRSLFNGMQELDKKGLYHGDLNNGNLKINRDGDVNFIDFQWGTITPQNRFYENNSEQIMPNFMPIQNSQMFEMAEVPYYLKHVDNSIQGKKFLTDYLSEKSRYHKARLNNIYTTTQNWAYSTEIPNIEKAKKFEAAQEEVFRSPSEKILNLETLKIHFLSAFREASKYLDANTPHKNIIPSGTSYLYVLSTLQGLRKKIAEVKKSSYGKMIDYINGMTDFADYWYNNLTKWTKDAFYYPFRHTQGKLESWETLHNFNDPQINIEHFDNMTNVSKLIDDKYDANYTRNFDCDTFDIDHYKKEIDRYINSTKQNSSARNHQTYNGLIYAYNKLKKAYDDNKWLDVINNSLLLMRRCDEMYFYGDCSSIQASAAKLAENVFEKVFKDIKEWGPNYWTYPGYKNMNEFN